MAQQIINVGSKPNSGGGDALRDALIKVNENFTEVYADIAALQDGQVTTDIKGSVFADDSTLLVDAVNGIISAGVISGELERSNIPQGFLKFPEEGLLVFPPTPASTGTKGDVIYAGGYIYLCVSTNTWVRSAVETAWG